MQIRSTRVAIVALALAGGTAVVLAPVVHGQSREPLLELVGRDAQVGVIIHDAGKDDTSGGVIVDEVRSASAAEKAGIKAGDAIVEFDGERVRSAEQLRRLVNETPADRTVQAVLVRDGQRLTVPVTPQNRAEPWSRDDFALAPAAPVPPRIASAPRPYVLPAIPGFQTYSMHSADRMGVVLESLSDQLRDYFGVKQGVLVRTVVSESAAAKAGIKAGDVIVTVNGRTIDDPGDVTDEIARVDRGANVTLEISRNGKRQKLDVPVEARTHRVLRTRTIL